MRIELPDGIIIEGDDVKGRGKQGKKVHIRPSQFWENPKTKFFITTKNKEVVMLVDGNEMESVAWADEVTQVVTVTRDEFKIVIGGKKIKFRTTPELEGSDLE
ncbi:MAG: hypothetical protein EB060_00690 [Proteobacteria bacterium]|nr:hypothetical protein [Pseudomonadota bacterium]